MAKILVVEDDVVLAQQLESLLRLDHHVVEAVYNGADAIDFLRVSSYDLLILDWDLPIMDGPAVLDQMKKHSIRPRVLVLTGRSSIADKELAFAAGVDDFQSKPFVVRELRARIAALLRRTTVGTKPKVKFGNLSLDIDTRSARVSGREISLFPKEFEILKLLIESSGSPLSLETIVDRLSAHQTIRESSLRTYVKSLRQKLEQGGCNIVIKTDRGLGYYCQQVIDT
jgi:DNA-binding response OmpR family regulator